MTKWWHLSLDEQLVYSTTLRFLEGRLEERETIEWALRISPNDKVKQLAITDTFNFKYKGMMGEPWVTAWSLFIDFFEDQFSDDLTQGLYGALDDLGEFPLKPLLIREIIHNIRPRVLLEPLRGYQRKHGLNSQHPVLEELFRVSLTSARLYQEGMIKAENVTDPAFLYDLSIQIIVELDRAIRLAKRYKWNVKKQLHKLGSLSRAYYVAESDRPSDEDEPDGYRHGIAPSIKLLHAIVFRIGKLDTEMCLDLLSRIASKPDSAHQRLWAALARDPNLVSGETVGQYLTTLDEDWFWLAYWYPEFAELRARRFSDIPNALQIQICRRLRALPSKRLWPNTKWDKDDFRYRLAFNEFKRLAACNNEISKVDQNWIIRHGGRVPDVGEGSVTDGFATRARGSQVQDEPPEKFAEMSGRERLLELETDFAIDEDSYEGPRQKATAWLRADGNLEAVISDLLALASSISAYPEVWKRVAWSHCPHSDDNPASTSLVQTDVYLRVLSALGNAKSSELELIAPQVAEWLHRWRSALKSNPTAETLWITVFPFIDRLINRSTSTGNPTSPSQEVIEIDSQCKTSIRAMIYTFLDWCPKVDWDRESFPSVGNIATMLNLLTRTNRLTLAMVRRQLVEHLGYFLHAAPVWSREILIAPLKTHGVESDLLWRSVAHNYHYSDALSLIGDYMIRQVISSDVSGSTRKVLIESLVWEVLISFYHSRLSVIDVIKFQQALRTMDDEGRMLVVDCLCEHLKQVPKMEQPIASEDFYNQAVKRFLSKVWPQERALTSEGISKAFARLPAKTGKEFPDAVAGVRRFLVPFRCYSTRELGITLGDKGESLLMKLVNTADKAASLLVLLSAVIGEGEPEGIPLELGEALGHIASVSPVLGRNPTYQHLLALTRR